MERCIIRGMGTRAFSLVLPREEFCVHMALKACLPNPQSSDTSTISSFVHHYLNRGPGDDILPTHSRKEWFEGQNVF